MGEENKKVQMLKKKTEMCIAVFFKPALGQLVNTDIPLTTIQLTRSVYTSKVLYEVQNNK